MNELQIIKNCEITPTYLKLTDEVTEEEALQIFERFGGFVNKGMVYIGDLANEVARIGLIKVGRGNESSFYKKAAIRSGLKLTSIMQSKTIMGNIKTFNRLKSLGIRHYQLVYQLPAKEQKKYLQKCIDEGWSTKKLKNEIAKAQPSPEIPEGQYQVIYADPPWAYDSVVSSKEVSEHYNTMELEDLIEVGEKVKPIAYKNSVLYMWATTARLDWAFPVIEAWGFKYLTSMIWDKVEHMVGHYCSMRHEILLIAGKGQSSPKDTKLANSIDSVQVIKKSGIHSRKPKDIRDIITKLYPTAKKIELFSREETKGWTAWGNEVSKKI